MPISSSPYGIPPAAGLASRFRPRSCTPNDRYPMLNGGPKCASQLDRLERFARQLHALPLYLLYNHSNNRTAFRALALLEAFRRRSTGLHARPRVGTFGA